MFAWVFEILADQHDTMEHNAHHLYEDMLSRGIKPADLDANGALMELGLAELAEDSNLLDEHPVFIYHDPLVQIEQERVRATLLGDDEGCDV